MNINDSFPSNYIKHSDLQGGIVKVTMSHVTIEELGSGDDKNTKPILFFEGRSKGLALNKTNSHVIADAYGTETDGWAGQVLELYPDKTQYKGDVVDCIRVRKPLEHAPDESIAF